MLSTAHLFPVIDLFRRLTNEDSLCSYSHWQNSRLMAHFSIILNMTVWNLNKRKKKNRLLSILQIQISQIRHGRQRSFFYSFFYYFYQTRSVALENRGMANKRSMILLCLWTTFHCMFAVESTYYCCRHSFSLSLSLSISLSLTRSTRIIKQNLFKYCVYSIQLM
jgi:hypothetical protein